MFDIGFWELALIGVVALLVVGPERLPALARTVGRWAGKARRMADQVRREVERELDLAELRELNKKIDVRRVDDWLEPPKGTEPRSREAPEAEEEPEPPSRDEPEPKAKESS